MKCTLIKLYIIICTLITSMYIMHCICKATGITKLHKFTHIKHKFIYRLTKQALAATFLQCEISCCATLAFSLRKQLLKQTRNRTVWQHIPLRFNSAEKQKDSNLKHLLCYCLVVSYTVFIQGLEMSLTGRREQNKNNQSSNALFFN